MNSIPPEERTPAQIKAHMELYNQTQDIWLIHNPDEEDYAFYYNRRFEPNPYIVPGCNKDVGFGKGNLEVKYYLAEIYAEQKCALMIQAISRAKWDVDKLQYRLEERGQMEERLALKVNNRQLQEKIIPQLMLGCVRRSNEEIGMGEVVQEKPVDTSQSNVRQIMEKLGMTDKEVSLAHDAQQQSMSDEDKRKAELIQSIV